MFASPLFHPHMLFPFPSQVQAESANIVLFRNKWREGRTTRIKHYRFSTESWQGCALQVIFIHILRDFHVHPRPDNNNSTHRVLYGSFFLHP